MENLYWKSLTTTSSILCCQIPWSNPRNGGRRRVENSWYFLRRHCRFNIHPVPLPLPGIYHLCVMLISSFSLALTLPIIFTITSLAWHIHMSENSMEQISVLCHEHKAPLTPIHGPFLASRIVKQSECKAASPWAEISSAAFHSRGIHLDPLAKES